MNKPNNNIPNPTRENRMRLDQISTQVKTAYDFENFVIVSPSKSGRQNIVCLTPEEARGLANEIYEAVKDWEKLSWSRDDDHDEFP
jgi:hypothetical protein